MSLTEERARRGGVYPALLLLLKSVFSFTSMQLSCLSQEVNPNADLKSNEQKGDFNSQQGGKQGGWEVQVSRTIHRTEHKTEERRS